MQDLYVLFLKKSLSIDIFSLNNIINIFYKKIVVKPSPHNIIAVTI